MACFRLDRDDFLGHTVTDTIANSPDKRLSFLSYPKDTVLRPVWRGVLNWVGKKPIRLRNSRPIISFAFDDFPRTALSEGARILEGAGARGTFYTALGLAGTINSLGEQFQKEDLHELVERGHELASHTFDHVSARDVSNSSFLLNVRRGEQLMQPMTGLTPTANFAYPFGCTNVRLKVKVGRLMQSCRGNFPGLNGPVTDLNLLRANALYGGSEALNSAVKLIEANSRSNSWLIFYTHDVRRAPSKFGCTPELLETLLKVVSSQDCRIMTIADVVNHEGAIN